LEASKEIRSLGFTPAQLPILAVTGQPMKMETLEAHGIQDILVKPFTVEEIAGKLAAFLPV
jgi:CheY-like chemotaxis protein